MDILFAQHVSFLAIDPKHNYPLFTSNEMALFAVFHSHKSNATAKKLPLDGNIVLSQIQEDVSK
jgi:hypothetical protein